MALILAVDDERDALGSIRRVLEDAGHEVLTANNGTDALTILHNNQPQVVILDVIMPDMNGIEVCKKIRANPFMTKIPILFLTAKSRPGDIAAGLDAGGDDYVTKPFQVIELPARIRALLRRSSGGNLKSDADTLTVGDMTISLDKFELHVENQQYELTTIEHRLMYYLMYHAGQPQSVDQLLQHVWDYPPGTGDPALVYAHIKNLRQKIEPQSDKPTYILNVRGSGYLVRNPASN